MWIELFLCLLLAHLVSDFVLQTSKSCKDKKDNRWYSLYHYIHTFIVFGLSWLVAFDLSFWWCALIIGMAHFGIDMWKSHLEEKLEWFVLDQAMHILILIGISYLWCEIHKWAMPLGIDSDIVFKVLAVLICWKPSNIFIKLVLKHYSVNMPTEKSSGFNAGALIGTIERWLILIFVCLQRYDALGLLIAAKSIIRFSEKDTERTEYVLAGTLLSIFIAIMAGLLLSFSNP